MSDETPPEISAGGVPILRHGLRRTRFEPVLNDPEVEARRTEHIRTHIGPIALTYREVVPDLVQVNVHVVAPTPKRNWYTLVTSGMSDRPMAAPPDLVGAEYAEMMLCLPPDWPLALTHNQVQMSAPEASYWPLRWLKILARFPHAYDAWLWWGHTLPNDEPPQPFAPNTALCGLLLSDPTLAARGFGELPLAPDRTVRYFSVVPIYATEMEHALQYGAESLMDRLKSRRVSELLALRRPNVCPPPPQAFSRRPS